MPDRETFRRVVARYVGSCAIIGQTDDLAPADKRLYAIRYVTATVESVPLITASILSKKLAAGLDGLAMDVKFGNGAFMSSREKAQELADALVEVATGAGLPTRALLTDMDQPLATVAGNAFFEVVYAIHYLTGAKREPWMHEVVVALGAEMLVLASLATDTDAGRAQLEAALDGAAAEKFAEMVVALGGPADLVEHPDRHLERADVVVPVAPEHAGQVSAIETREVGLAVVTLGGGRTRPQDPIDPAVGLTELAEVGAAVGADRPLAIVHARTAEQADLAALGRSACRLHRRRLSLVAVVELASALVGSNGEGTVDVVDDGPVRIVTIVRPERRNAVDAATAAALLGAFEAFDADETAHVAVLTGAGGYFCAGADLKAIAGGRATPGVRHRRGSRVRWARPGCGSASR